jgi:UPF0755 protein
VKAVFATVAVAVFLLAGSATGLVLLDRPAPGIPVEGALFAVTPGETLRQIAGRLERQGLVRSSLLLRALARLHGTEQRFKAGYYRIRSTYDTRAVHDLLVEGKQDQVAVTIPEGWTLGRIATYLEEKSVATREDFLQAARNASILDRYGIPGPTLEGYLYPDTYFLSQNMPAELIAEEMVLNFYRRLEEIAPDRGELDTRALNEKVIMASIVEREYRVAEEAPYIASVFYNRLRYGIGFESCATVAYIISEIQGNPYPLQLTGEDLRIDSPFNTYKWAGFPPAPISNPGRTALEAVFKPASTDYFYFVLRDSAAGSHYFSRDLDEHNSAKRFYLKGLGAGG